MSAPSRLSSLLVRDSVIGVKRMEQAFQRQVIYGGALDTILLEMNAVPEERLVQYLSLATGLPAADRDLLEYFDPRAVQVCPRHIAEQYRVAPVALDGTALRCLVTDPVDLAGLESLATLLGAPVQPFVVSEYRFHMLLERLFGIATPSRFALIAAKRAQTPATKPVPAEPKVIVDDPGVAHEQHAAKPASVQPKEPKPRSTIAFSTDALQQALAQQEQQRAATAASQAAPVSPPPDAVIVDTPIPPQTSAVEIPPQADALGGVTRGSMAMRAIVPTGPAHEAATVVVSSSPETSPATGVVKAPWRGGDTVDPKPLTNAEAVAELARATDRDSIFAALVRAARGRTWYSAMLTVQSNVAIGRVGIDGDQPDADIAQVAIRLDAPKSNAFRSAIEGRAPYIGPVRTGKPEIDGMLELMGGVVPPSALILPIVIRERVVALLYAHRGADTVSISEVAELLPLASDAALALGKLIMRAKAEGYRKADASTPAQVPPPSIAAQIEIGELPAKTARGHRADGTWTKPDAQAAIPAPAALDFGAEVSLGGGVSGPIPGVVDVIEAGAEPAASKAIAEALARVDELIPELLRRFPGKLWIDRYATGGRSVRASQHGPLLALAVRVGPRVVPVLVDRMNAEERETRYYATLCCGEVRAPIAVPGLVTRLFDADYGVRDAALEALLGYSARDIDAALEPVRRALRADSAKARAAAHALGELRDVRAIPELIDALDRDHLTAEEAHRALVLLCKQDFGAKAKKWKAWWDKNRERPRIEWMLDGLASSEDKVRLSASEELKRLTGEYFGYHHDLPKREREEARLRWVKWWEETGRKRFLRPDARDEHDRNTALLPTMGPPRR